MACTRSTLKPSYLSNNFQKLFIPWKKISGKFQLNNNQAFWDTRPITYLKSIIISIDISRKKEIPDIIPNTKGNTIGNDNTSNSKLGIFQTCRFQLRLQGSFSALGRACSESNKTVIMIFPLTGLKSKFKCCLTLIKLMLWITMEVT